MNGVSKLVMKSHDNSPPEGTSISRALGELRLELDLPVSEPEEKWILFVLEFSDSAEVPADVSKEEFDEFEESFDIRERTVWLEPVDEFDSISELPDTSEVRDASLLSLSDTLNSETCWPISDREDWLQ